jgi:hypothetical protein
MNTEKQTPFNPDISNFTEQELAFHIPELSREMAKLAIHENE